MKKVIFLCISMFVMQQTLFAGPIFSTMKKARYYDFDQECSDFSATHDSTDIESYSSECFDFISITSNGEYVVSDDISISSEISIEDELYMTSLFEELIQAIKKDNFHMVEKIVHYNPDIVHLQDCFGLTPLHHAFNLEDGYQLNSSIITLLINCGADQYIEDGQGISPQDLADSYKNLIQKDCTATDKDFDVVSRVYQSMSPNSPQIRKKLY